MENQRLIRAFPTAERSSVTSALADEARSIAATVRRIGRGRGASPEAMLIEKHEAADRLLALAAQMEAAGW